MATKTAKQLPVIGVSTLGCPKNLVDTENIIGILHGAGYQISSDHQKADLSLVNTCTFIEDSSNESAEVLGELADAGQKLIITGCMAQRYKADLFDELPEAQAVVGTGNVKDILDVVRRVTEKLNAGEDAKIVCVDEKPESVADAATPRMRTQLSPSVYLKIAEGCDHRCAFCIIPHLRGDMNSRTIEDIVEEAKLAVEQGAQELVLVSQDSSAYGTDIYKRRALAGLLEAVASQSGAKWIRVMYAYPTEMDEEMLAVIAKHSNLLNYVDIPLQHAAREVLLRMKRPPTVRDTVAMIKDKLPGACIRTVFIVGFPGETDEDFQELYDFVKESRFDRVGVFTYSKELGTTAYDLPDQIDEAVKEERKDKLMRLQQQISLEKNQEQIGNQLTMLVEEIAEQEDGNFQIIGRSFRDAPEIDGQLYASLGADEILPAPGSFVQAEVTGCDEYDLFVYLTF